MASIVRSLPKHRVYAPAAAARFAPEETTTHYLRNVLRLRDGAQLRIFDGRGGEWLGRIHVKGKDVELEKLAPLSPIAESPLALTLTQGIARGDRTDTALQKAVELGVSVLQPVFAQRSEVRLDGARLERRLAHWRALVISACEQCGRATLPELLPAVELFDLQPESHAIVLDPKADNELADMDLDREVDLWVGPEGGWDDSEYAWFAARGLRRARLGPRVLRSETAGPAALAVLQAKLGDFR